MISALFLLLVSQAPAVSPVRVWLGSGPSLASGAREVIYVQTSADGHLVVLQARPDGRVEVLFPEDPASDPFVQAGTYEIRGPASSGTAGRGMVVAALSPDPIWFNEFVHRSNWDAASLSGASAGADPEAVLTDIVQRMLGDGSFNYDLATYAVTRPPSVRAVPLMARTRSAAAQAAELVRRTRLLTRVLKVTRSPSPGPEPADEPTRAWVAAPPVPVPAATDRTPAPAPVVVLLIMAPAPMAARGPRAVARPHTRIGAAQAGPAQAAPAPPRAGAATVVGLGQVHTAGWRHQ